MRPTVGTIRRLKITPYEEALKAAQAWCDRLAPGTRVLDAGSGLRSYVAFPPNVHVTGVDISRELLDRNARLDERIHADLETWTPDRVYDCIVCWEVLEHLRNPRAAVARLAEAVAPDGLLIVGSPNPRSLKGLVTRLSPHWFHQWLYSRFFEGGDDPYHTFMRAGGGFRAVDAVAQEAGLSSVYAAWVESPMQLSLRERFRLTGGAWRVLRALAGLVRIDSDATDYVAVWKRQTIAVRHRSNGRDSSLAQSTGTIE